MVSRTLQSHGLPDACPLSYITVVSAVRLLFTTVSYNDMTVGLTISAC